MAQETTTHPLARWLWLPWEIAIGFLVSGFAAWALLSNILSWPDPAIGFLVAAAVVVMTYVRAPNHRLLASALSLVLGAIFAYILLRGSTFPENHPRGYEQTFIPLWCTLAGGMAAFCACAFHSLRAGAPSNKSLERTREG
jgi:hypothetical protein